MSAADKLGGYASGFGDLNAEAIAANVTTDYKLLDKDGAVYGKNDLPGYIAELRKIGDKMDITDVVVEGGTLSANITETPATFGISVGRLTAERDSMTL